jgi:hypothetical protein
MRFALLPMPDGSKLAVNPNYVVKVEPETKDRALVTVAHGAGHAALTVAAGSDVVCAIVENAWRDTAPVRAL